MRLTRKPLRRKPSRDDFSGGYSHGSTRRNYCFVAFLLVYSLCTSIYINRGMSRSLSSSQPMIRGSSSADYYLTGLRTVDNVPYPTNSNDAAVDNGLYHRHTNDDLSSPQSPKPEDTGFSAVEVHSTAEPVPQKPSSATAVAMEESAVVAGPPPPKPRLFLHVGPQKTGSSTLQSMLDKLSALTGKLSGDDLRYRHIMPEAGDFDCVLDEWGGWHDCRASDSLRALIRTAREEGTNLLLTDENLNANFARGLREAIDDAEWDVTVIVVYRRIHEWLVSWYNQIHKTTNRDSTGAVLFNEAGIPYRTAHTLWPDRGGVHVPGFGSWYDDYTRGWEPSELAGRHRSIEYFRLYRESFGKVLLYDMHRDGSMILDFLCNIFGAAHACERMRSGEIPIEKVNGSVHLDHDILAVTAYERGLVPRTLSRQAVVAAVTARVQAEGLSVPRRCDPARESQIRSWLVETERIAVEEDPVRFWSDAVERALLETYDSFVATGKLCDVDTDAVFRDEGWMRWFGSLEGPPKGNLVLHVGPVGGDTTREALAGLSGPLKDDNYTVVDIDTSGETMFDCQSNSERCLATPKLRSVFSSLEDTRTNVLVVNDNLGKRFVQALKDAIDEDRWNVKIVVGYARRDRFLLSRYDRDFNFLGRAEESRSLAPAVSEAYSRWPGGGGGSPIPGFYDWVRAVTSGDTEKGPEHELRRSLVATRHRRDAYAAVFDDVDVRAVAAAVDTPTELPCKILPGASRACAAARESPDAATVSFDDSFAAADLLANQARRMGLLVSGLSRTAVRAAARAELKRRRSNKQLPARICNAEVTKRLYDDMIADETALSGDRFLSKHRIARINEEFQHLLESGTFCAVDASKELRDNGGSWKRLFRDLGGVGDGAAPPQAQQ